MVCIVESKAANREQMRGAKQKATDNIREYLEEDTFCKYLRDVDQRYLVGIGTDGLRWTLWMKDLETGETRGATPKITEKEVIRLNTIEGDVFKSRKVERDTLLQDFIPAFAADNLLSHVKTEFID